MHILFLSDNFPPEVNAPANRTFEHCKVWAAAGHKVTVITSAPNFPKGKLLAGYRNSLWQRERMDGIEVIRVWTYIAANDGFALRILDYLSYAFTSAVAGMFVRSVDVVVATSPQLFTALAGCLVGMFKRKPYIFELRDLWPESIRAVGAMRESWTLAQLERLEMWLYRQATHIVSNTRAFSRNLIDRGIEPSKISVVTNGVDLRRFGSMSKNRPLVETLKLDGKFVVGYVGTMGMAHGLETLLDCAQQLQSQADLVFLLVGDGARKQTLKTMAADRRIENVQFIDSVPRDQVMAYWSLLDVSVIHLKDEPLFETVIPSKLFECMGMGLPVIHAVRGESAEIVSSECCGVIVEPENVDAMAQAIMELHNDPERRYELRLNAIRAAPKYDRSRLANDMMAILTKASAVAGPSKPKFAGQ